MLFDLFTSKHKVDGEGAARTYKAAASTNSHIRTYAIRGLRGTLLRKKR